jgi:hypothetical protein
MLMTGFGGEGQGDGDLRARNSKRGDDSGTLLAECGGVGVDAHARQCQQKQDLGSASHRGFGVSALVRRRVQHCKHTHARMHGNARPLASGKGEGGLGAERQDCL